MEISPVANDNTAVPPFTKPGSLPPTAALKDQRTVICSSPMTNRLVQKIIELDKWLGGLEKAYGYSRITDDEYLRLRQGCSSVSIAVDSIIGELKRAPAVRDQVGRFGGRSRPTGKPQGPKQAAQSKPQRPQKAAAAVKPVAPSKPAPAQAAVAAPAPEVPSAQAPAAVQVERVSTDAVKALDTSAL